jgi:3-oxoacyl-[acyl-carrier-protein] synthase II
MKRRAVITGLGIVSPIGVGVECFWVSARAGRSGIGPATLFDASKLPRECHIVGEVTDFDAKQWMPGAAGRMAGRFSQFAVAAAKMARDDAKLESAQIPPERIRVSIGTSMNGLADVHQPNFETFLDRGFISPWACLEYPAHAATSHVAIESQARGQATSFATACAAGLDAVTWAAQQIEGGLATAAIAKGTDTPLSECTVMALHAVGVLPKWLGPPEEASRPFDRLRDGLVIAEGAAVVVVEDEESARSRGAHIYAYIEGSGNATEGAHLRKVDQSGDAGSQAMRLALKSARMEPRDIDYVAAHGNSMRDYDSAETASIKRVFGKHAWNMPISSLKSMCGQALAASSAMQVVAACLVLRDQIVLPTINHTTPDPSCDLD